MGVVEQRERLFEAIVRLRRAERRGPPDEDLAAVRSMLERDLGATMSRRTAARLLGVHHKSLDRWIKSGDLPVVQGTSGRVEVPTASVLDLFEAVEETRANSTRTRHQLEPTLAAGRARAERLRPSELLQAGEAGGHSRAERRSLAYHRALAKQLRRKMVNDALTLLWRWREEGRIDERYAEQWEQVLGEPLAEIRRVLGEDSQRGRDLRQNSPFAGMLSEAERRRINEDIG